MYVAVLSSVCGRPLTSCPFPVGCSEEKEEEEGAQTAQVGAGEGSFFERV